MKSRVYWFIILFFGLVANSHSKQKSDKTDLYVVDVPLVAWVAAQPHASPDSLYDLGIAPRTRQRFEQLILRATQKNWSEAKKLATRIGYEMLILSGNKGRYFVLQESRSRGIGPTIVISESPKRNAIAGVPHPAFEKGTAEQAALLVDRLGFRAAVIAGAHRCAAQTFVQCRGSTTVCGDRKGSQYRKSDGAHNPETLYHSAHQLLTRLWPKSIVFSLHGMRKRGSNIAILSDGSKTVYDDSNNLVGKIRDNLRSLLSPGVGDVVSCNHSDDKARKFPKLCGYTNIQGIALNGGSAECGLSVVNSSGRFVHLEQSWEFLGEFRRHWEKIDSTKNAMPLLESIGRAIPEIEKN